MSTAIDSTRLVVAVKRQKLKRTTACTCWNISTGPRVEHRQCAHGSGVTSLPCRCCRIMSNWLAWVWFRLSARHLVWANANWFPNRFCFVYTLHKSKQIQINTTLRYLARACWAYNKKNKKCCGVFSFFFCLFCRWFLRYPRANSCLQVVAEVGKTVVLLLRVHPARAPRRTAGPS